MSKVNELHQDELGRIYRDYPSKLTRKQAEEAARKLGMESTEIEAMLDMLEGI